MVPAREPPLRRSGGWFNDQTIWAALPLQCPALSPDGHRLAVTTGRALLLVDVAQGEPIGSIAKAVEGGLDCGLTFSADGALLTAVDRSEVKTWEIPSGRLHSTRPRRETDEVEHPGRRLRVVSDERLSATPNDRLGLSDISDEQYPLFSAGQTVVNRVLEWKRKGDQIMGTAIAIAVRRTPEGWSSPGVVWAPNRPMVAFDMSTDGRYLAVAGMHAVVVKDLKDDRVTTMAAHGSKYVIDSLRLSASGRYLWGENRMDLVAWRTSDGKSLWCRPSDGKPTFLEASGLVWVDGRRDRDWLLRAEDGKQVLVLDQETQAALESPSTGRLLTIVNHKGGGRLTLRDFATGEPLPRSPAHRGAIRAIAVLPGASAIITVDDTGLALERNLTSGRTIPAQLTSPLPDSTLPAGWTVKLWRAALKISWQGDSAVLSFDGESPTAVQVTLPDRQVFVGTNLANVYRYDLVSSP